MQVIQVGVYSGSRLVSVHEGEPKVAWQAACAEVRKYMMWPYLEPTWALRLTGRSTHVANFVPPLSRPGD